MRNGQVKELSKRLDETIKWWRRWSSGVRLEGPFGDGAVRSAMLLKALIHAPTGAMAAAPTTSLPEIVGGPANWDYRYSWVRDSSFAARALVQLGRDNEADGFRRFVERSAAGHADELQIAAVTGTRIAATDPGNAAGLDVLRLLVAYDGVIGTASFLLFDAVWRACDAVGVASRP